MGAEHPQSVPRGFPPAHGSGQRLCGRRRSRGGFRELVFGEEDEKGAAFDKGFGEPRTDDPIDRVNGRPDFLILVYPGGEVPVVVLADTPPTRRLCANDDEYGCGDVAMILAERRRAASVPVELHLLSRGRLAFNMGDRSGIQSFRHWPAGPAEL